MKTAIYVLLLCSIAPVVSAQVPYLVNPSNGEYLGNLSANQFDQNSTSNPFGQYGSKFSQDSINNQFGPYGSPFSNKSANNPYATNPPVVVQPNPLDLNQGQAFQGFPLLEW